jgi:hypothetical protein
MEKLLPGIVPIERSKRKEEIRTEGERLLGRLDILAA